MLSYVCNGGRLGENISYIYGLFKFCKNNNVPFDNIVINYNYKSKSLLKNKRDEYVFYDCMEMFDNIRYCFKDINLDNFKIIDLGAKVDITLLYSFYKYNNYRIMDNIKFKDYWSLDSFYINQDLLFDIDLLNYICRPKKLVRRLKNKYSNILTDDCIGIHVRREDYIALENKDILIDSVQNNMSSFYKHKKLYTISDINNMIYDYKNCNILIFSDDCEWCKNNFGSYDNVYIIEGNKAYEDMILLSLCSKVIRNPGSFFSQISYILNRRNV